jgi:hypothetical protein
MVDDNLGNLLHHGKIRQPRNMAAMEIFGRILQPYYPKPLDKVFEESGLAGFLRETTFTKGGGQFTTPTMLNHQIMPSARDGGRDGHR